MTCGLRCPPATGLFQPVFLCSWFLLCPDFSVCCSLVTSVFCVIRSGCILVVVSCTKLHIFTIVEAFNDSSQSVSKLSVSVTLLWKDKDVSTFDCVRVFLQMSVLDSSNQMLTKEFQCCKPVVCRFSWTDSCNILSCFDVNVLVLLIMWKKERHH